MFNLIPWKKKNSGSDLREWNEDDFYSVARLRSEFDSLWDRFASDWQSGWGPWQNEFRLGIPGNLEDNPDEFLFRADLPGFEPADIDVQVSGNTLSIKAEHKDEKKEEGKSSYRSSSFHHHVTLPHGVDAEHIDASYRNGVLELHLPKTEEAKGKRIPVNAAAHIEQS